MLSREVRSAPTRYLLRVAGWEVCFAATAAARYCGLGVLGCPPPRAQVLYLPDAGVLTAGGTFKRSDTEAGAFDTPESAQLLLHNLLAAHKEQLGRLRAPDGASSLEEVRGRVVPSARPCCEPPQLCPCHVLHSQRTGEV